MEQLNQIERIKRKLIIAKEADKKLKVFGAGSHKYILGKPLKPEVIQKFENEYQLDLPKAYKAFLLHIGNGGVSYQNSAAGPSYGIYALGENLNEFIYENAEAYLKQDCKIYPTMSGDFWSDLNKNIDENDEMSEEDFDLELGKIFSGLLPLGSQGCTYYHALVLNGEFKGRIVNVDSERQKPFFAFESNFLDWYERWLDEIIPEDRMAAEPSLFRYTLSGLSSYVLEVYFSAKDYETKKECLNAIVKKDQLNLEVLDVLEKEYNLRSGEIQKDILQILTKFDYERAKPYLIDFAKEDLLAVFQFVFWYAKDKSTDWLEVIRSNADTINNEETFRFCTYLLKEMNFDYGEIVIPFTSNKNENIRISAYYSLGELGDKSKYIDVFIAGLVDDSNSNSVIRTVLQALEGVKDRKLLMHYKKIAEKFTKEEDYILSNLNQRLKPYGFTNETIKKIDTDLEMGNDDVKWYEFWK